mmetsp:Transcript_35920/g.48219  ORF Transcript_35920/g.48219 Transcript_35920/m.48219 type:complete len:91 (-) Transcript_35920:536-808(-)
MLSLPSFEKCNMSKEQHSIKMTEILKTVSDPVILLTQYTPQNKALEWIFEVNELYSCPQESKFVQRYIMAVFYYSTNGDYWNECNAPGKC